MKKSDITILCVDDEPDILEIIKYNLSNEGYKVYTANDGVSAILKANEINPNLKKFLDTNLIWRQFFIKNKEAFKDIRERLVEISHKLGISVTDFKIPLTFKL